MYLMWHMEPTHEDDLILLFGPSHAEISKICFLNSSISFSGPDTMHWAFHFNAGVFVQVHRLCIFNLP